MTQKTQDRLLKDAMLAYDEENKQKKAWEKEAHTWHDRALQAELLNELTPWLFLAVIIAIVFVVYFWSV